MDYTQKILLNSSINKEATNENASLNINFSGNKRLLPEEDINDSVDAFNVYLDERKKSNKFRLVVNVNPFCSNVLFNPFTEIVLSGGSSAAVSLNYTPMTTEQINDGKNKILVKTDDFTWNQYESIRDTQLSNEICGFEYYCGLDIFNNHTLRQRGMTSVNYHYSLSEAKLGNLKMPYGESYENVFVNEAYKDAKTDAEREAHKHVYVGNNFNTIDDYMRDKEGVIISDSIPRVTSYYRVVGDSTVNYRKNNKTYVLPFHLYQGYNTKTFEEAVYEDLIEDNGWYGFKNEMTLGRINVEEENNPIEINKTINNREYCDFIDMYPGRELYSFTPIYNQYRNRLERNWDYCITYPSRNVVDNSGTEFPFFYTDSSGKTALRVYMFDEGTVDDNGTKLLTIYTVCQHGLMEGDAINIYKNDDLFYNSVKVLHVVDKYTFQVTKDTANMSDEWIELDDRGDGVWLHTDGNYYPICASNRCNVDPDAQNVYFRRVVNGVECEYYVRMFSRLPNFKFRDEEVNDYTLYDDDYVKNHKVNKRVGNNYYPFTLIERFSTPGDEKCEFESHAAKLGFSDTSYGDDTTEIVFTDDIDTSYLRDNLGRPLSDIYLTIIKNNRGYKQWYGINSGIQINDRRVEYSHCFGKVNAGFLFSEFFREFYNTEYDTNYTNLRDIRDITSQSGNKHALSTVNTVESLDEHDEIEFNNDFDYYGDICCFSTVGYDEQVIQNAMHRFNTVQREIQTLNAEARDYFKSYESDDAGTITVDEIKDDEYTLYYDRSNKGDPYEYFENGDITKKSGGEITPQPRELYHTANKLYENMARFREGYYYQPHYRISVKTVSSKLSEDKAIQYEIFEFTDTNTTNRQNREIFEITTTEPNYFLINEKMVMYKRSANEYFYITVTKPIDFNKFKCVIADDNGNHLNIVDFLHDNEVVKGTWGDDGSFTESEEGSNYAVKMEDLYIKPNDYILENINDYIIIKKHEETPAYAKLIKDGSCRYCWREVVSNGIEDGKNVFPFTNGAFYINRRINFYLRRQDPYKEYLGRVGTNVYDYVPDGEDIRDYPNLNFYDDNYNINEIEEC